jgi:AraC-like DNA-binding protein
MLWMPKLVRPYPDIQASLTGVTVMQLSCFKSESPAEAADILGREWSKHGISPSKRASFSMSFRKRSIGSHVSLNSLAYGSGVRIDPKDRDEVILLKMPWRGNASASYLRGDVEINSRCFSIVDVRRVAHVVCDSDFDVLVLRIRLSRFKAYLESALGSTPRKELEFTPELRIGSEAWTLWSPIAAALNALHLNDSPSISSRFLDPLEETIISALLTSQPNSYLEDLIRPASSVAPKHVRRAEQFIQEHAGEIITTEIIAQYVGVSIRALFDGFKSFRGTTPADYVKTLRLERARKDLLQGKGNVSEIATRWGFRHVGTFAALYRNRFGEMPSQTLRFNPSLK